MATTAAETSSSSGTKPEQKNDQKADSGDRRRRTRGGGDERPQTRLDDHVDAPSTMQPGDAPFDTTDPNERASSVSPDKAAAARGGHGTVNAVVPLPEPEVEETEDADPRYEEYKTRGPDGKLVSVKRNLETGENEIG